MQGISKAVFEFHDDGTVLVTATPIDGKPVAHVFGHHNAADIIGGHMREEQLAEWGTPDDPTEYDDDVGPVVEEVAPPPVLAPRRTLARRSTKTAKKRR